MNPQVEWAVADPIDKYIKQQHDSTMLKRSVDCVIRALQQRSQQRFNSAAADLGAAIEKLVLDADAAHDGVGSSRG